MDKVEDIEPGIQRVVLDTKELYPDYEEHCRFEARLREFLEVDVISEIMTYDDGILSYLTESVIPTKQDSRPPLLLLFGNPAPNSVLNKCFFASGKGKRGHRFWTVLEKAGIITFKYTGEDNNTFRTRSLFDLNYESPFRIGLAVFYSMPSPASYRKWSGVAGVRKLFGVKAFREITSREKERLDSLIPKYVGGEPPGAIIAFQKDTYLGVKDYNGQDLPVDEEGKWRVVETKCLYSDIRLFRMPPTRFVRASWYVKFLRRSRDCILGEG